MHRNNKNERTFTNESRIIRKKKGKHINRIE